MSEVEIVVDTFDERYRALRLVRPRSVLTMRESLERCGQLTATIAVRCEDEKLALLDGFKRLDAVRHLGRKVLRTRVVEMSEQAAVAAIYHFNQSGRGLNDLEQALVVRRLYRDHGLTQLEIGELLGRHKSWVSRRLQLIERLSEDVQNDLRVGLTSITVAREVSRLPRGNQGEVAASIAEHGLTTRQAARFVELFEQTSQRSQQRAILETPHQALDADASTRPSTITPDPRLSRTANRLRRQLLTLSAQESRLMAMLDCVLPQQWSALESDQLLPLIERTRQHTDDLLGALKELEAAAKTKENL